MALQVGSRISGGPYNYGIGIVTAIHANPNPNCYMIGRSMEPVAGLVDIVWPTHETKQSPANIYAGPPYRIHDGLGSAEEIANLRALAAIHQAQEAAKAGEAAAARLVLRDKLLADYPHLIRDDDNGPGSLICAAKNCRKLLAAAFPGVKFSVKTERYSGGNSLNISWADGPNAAAVEAIAKQFQGGHFDGMTDCYDYSNDVWNDLFGDAKFVFCSRQYSDALIVATLDAVAKELGGLDRVPVLDDYKQGRLWQVQQSGGCDYEREVRCALADFSAAA